MVCHFSYPFTSRWIFIFYESDSIYLFKPSWYILINKHYIYWAPPPTSEAFGRSFTALSFLYFFLNYFVFQHSAHGQFQLITLGKKKKKGGCAHSPRPRILYIEPTSGPMSTCHLTSTKTFSIGLCYCFVLIVNAFL